MARQSLDADSLATIVCFDEETSEPIELDLRGSQADVAARYVVDQSPALGSASNDAQQHDEPAPARGPGRPKLGVVAREVTLLPRHWEWLATQPGGASVALRRLVEDARRTSAASDARRISRESTYRFMSAMGGNRAGFEEATRALYAGDSARFEVLLQAWPPDLRDHALHLAAPAFVVVHE